MVIISRRVAAAFANTNQVKEDLEGIAIAWIVVGIIEWAIFGPLWGYGVIPIWLALLLIFLATPLLMASIYLYVQLRNAIIDDLKDFIRGRARKPDPTLVSRNETMVDLTSNNRCVRKSNKLYTEVK